MISEKIRELRKKNGMTQGELAEALFVSPQAVSKWEKGESEPSMQTIEGLSNIFHVSIDELFGRETQEKEPPKTEYVYKEAPVVLGVCEECNKPIFDANELVRKSTWIRSGRSSSVEHQHIFCRTCDEKKKKRAYDNAVSAGLTRRKRSYWWSGLISGALFLIVLWYCIAQQVPVGATIGALVVSALFFPFLSCLFLDNNFIGDMVYGISRWGFVTFPGIIFSLDLDGIIWLLTVKLLFWILGIILAIASTLLALAVGLIVSVFVYPFALAKNYRSPEYQRI